MARESRTPDLSGADGVTIIELLIALSLLAVVLGAILVPMDIGARTQVRDAAWANTLQSARAGLDSMLREVRQAYTILATSPNSIEFNVVLGGSAEEVYYECDVAQAGASTRECTRVQTTIGGTLPAPASGAPVVTGLVNGTAAAPVFSYTPDGLNPTYLTASFQLSASGTLASAQRPLTHHFALSDGTALPNENLAQ